MSIGSRVRDERKRQNLTLKRVAEMAGISVSYLSDIEQERSKPSVPRLIDLAKVLNKNVAYFLEETAAKEEKDTYTIIDGDTLKLLEHLLTLNGFPEIIREFEGFENWSDSEKAELLSFLRTKRLYRKEHNE